MLNNYNSDYYELKNDFCGVPKDTTLFFFEKA